MKQVLTQPRVWACVAALWVGWAAPWSAADAQTTATWLNPVDGDWDDSANWDLGGLFPNNGQPGAGDTYDVVIDAAGSPYTVTADDLLLHLDALTLGGGLSQLKLHGGSILDADWIDAGGATIELMAKPVTLDEAVIRGATLGGSGTLNSYWRTAMLDGVTVEGDYRLTAVGIRVPGWGATNDLVVDGLLTVDAPLYFSGEQSIDGTGTLAIGQSVVSNDGDLVIGPNVQVVVADDPSGHGGVLRSTSSGLVRTLGQISMDRLGLDLSGVSHEGTTVVTNGAGLGFEDSVNLGTLDLTDASSFGTGRIWSSSGAIILGASVDAGIDGEYTAASLRTIDNSAGGFMELRGIIDNTGPTGVHFDAKTGDVRLRNAQILWGQVTVAPGREIAVFGDTTFRGVSLTGQLSVSNESDPSRNGRLILRDSFTGVGDATVRVRGRQGSVNIGRFGLFGNANDSDIHVRNVEFVLDGPIPDEPWTQAGPSDSALIVMYGHYNKLNGDSRFVFLDEDTVVRTGTGGGHVGGFLINHGTILADTPGALLKILSDDGGTENHGQIIARDGAAVLVPGDMEQFGAAQVVADTGGTIALYSDRTFRAESFDWVTRAGGRVHHGGGIAQNDGNTLLLDGVDESMEMWSGAFIHDGRIETRNGAVITVKPNDYFVVGPSAGATAWMENLELAGEVQLEAGASMYAVSVSFDDTVIRLTNGSRLGFTGTLGGETGHGRIVLDAEEAGNSPILTAELFGQAKIGSGVIVESGRSNGHVDAYIDGRTVVNEGQIIAGTRDRWINIRSKWLNDGSLIARDGGELRLDGGTNRGLIRAEGARLIARGDIMNEGAGVIESAGVLDFDGHTLHNGGIIRPGERTGRTQLRLLASPDGSILSGFADFPLEPFGLNALGEAGGGSDARTLLSFDLSGIDAQDIAGPATLVLTSSQADGASQDTTPTIELALLDGTFDEDTVTWNSRSAGTPWTTPGGDITATIDTFTGRNPTTFWAGQTMQFSSELLDAAVAAGAGGPWGVAVKLADESGTDRLAYQLITAEDPSGDGPVLIFEVVGPEYDTLTIDGHFAQTNTGTLELELAGNTPDLHDALAVTGDAALGGTLQILLAEGFVPDASDVFSILDVGGELSGAFDQVQVITAPVGSGPVAVSPGSIGQFDVAYDTETGQVTLTNYQPIPEPGTATLALLSLAGLALRRR